MDFGVTWDNEYVSVHMLEPDYSPMVAYPSRTRRAPTGKQVAQAVIVELATRQDLDPWRGSSAAWRC